VIEFGILEVHRVTLTGQRQRLVRQLLVGLLKLRLLSFKMGLGFLENPRLLFEFFVRGFQLFLLHLQLFIELLGLGQHFLQALTITGGFNRHADIVGNQF